MGCWGGGELLIKKERGVNYNGQNGRTRTGDVHAGNGILTIDKKRVRKRKRETEGISEEAKSYRSPSTINSVMDKAGERNEGSGLGKGGTQGTRRGSFSDRTNGRAKIFL